MRSAVSPFERAAGHTVGGVDCEFTVASARSLIAVVPARGLAGIAGPQLVTVTVTTKDAVPATKLNAVDFTLVRDNNPEPGLPTISLQRDNGGRATGIIISGNRNISPKELLDAIRSVLEHEKCCEEVLVDFLKASGKHAEKEKGD